MSGFPAHIQTLLSALRFQDAGREAVRTLTGQEWVDLFTRWDVQQLLIPLRRDCSGGADLPEWVRSRIDRNLIANAERLARIQAAYSHFSRALGETGAGHLVIKGFTLWPGFVDHPRYRLQSDIDIYCPPDSILRARDTLRELGYQPSNGWVSPWADHLPVMAPKSTWRWRGDYFDPEMPAQFELHFRLWNERALRIRPIGLEQFWERRVERSLDGARFPGLNAADNFGYAALNLARNLVLDQASPHQIYELARFLHLQREDRALWKEWRETHSGSLRRIEAASCRMAVRHFDCRVPDEVRDEMERLPKATKTWFDLCAEPSNLWPERPHKDWFWLHFSLLDSPGDRISILRTRLFPTRLSPICPTDLQGMDDGSPARPSPGRRLGRYVRNFASRLHYYFGLLPATLWRGARLWLAAHGRAASPRRMSPRPFSSI